MIIIIASIGILAVVIMGSKKDSSLPRDPISESRVDESVLVDQSLRNKEISYEPTIPKQATVSVPEKEIMITNAHNLSSKEKTFTLKATQKGFIPESITVNKDDVLVLNFDASDAEYDFDIPYLGAYFFPVKKGTVKRLSVETHTSGVFVFRCRDACGTKSIQGSLIVLP